MGVSGYFIRHLVCVQLEPKANFSYVEYLYSSSRLSSVIFTKAPPFSMFRWLMVPQPYGDIEVFLKKENNNNNKNIAAAHDTPVPAPYTDIIMPVYLL